MKPAKNLFTLALLGACSIAASAANAALLIGTVSAQGGEPMLFLNIGEPDFGAAPLVQQAAERCLREGRTQYTQATGLPELPPTMSAVLTKLNGVLRSRRDLCLIQDGGRSKGGWFFMAAAFS